MSVRTLTSVSRKAGTAQSAPEKARGFWLVLLISWVYGLLVCSLRIRLQDPARLLVRAEGAPHIFVFWHNRLLLIPLVWQRFLSTNRPVGVALISASRDGELMTRFLGRFGLTAVRGSGSKRGSTALRELAGWIRRGHDVGITPDGSRGPCYQVKPGLVLLAQLTGRPLLPITLEYSSAWRMRSWDRFFIPKPFSRVTFIVGEPLVIRRTSNLADFESERQRCEAVMCAQVSTL
jgi:lysophospholipid acyltransferase (LPLAT)-like uncharacterized protein